MAGFDDGFQVAIKQLRFKGVVRIGFITQAADVISDVIRATEQRNNLVHRMHTKAIKRAILRQPRFGFCHRAVIVKMAFHFNNLSQLATFNRFFRCQEAGVKATILIRRDGQPFAFRQRKQLLRLGKRRGERFFDQHIFPGFQRAFRVVKVAVGVGTDHHQLHLRII